jgi:molybdopterin converting factor small subunit
MTVRVKFLANFRDLFDAREMDVTLPANARLRGLLELLCDSPERRAQVLTPAAEIHPQVVIMKNGTPAQSLGGLDMPLEEGAVIAIFPFIGGG